VVPGLRRRYRARVIADLSLDDRLRLMRFICSWAWEDLEVRPRERAFVTRMTELLDLGAERAKIDAWLATPPSPETVDPTRVPADQRALFLSAARALFASDGRISDEEREAFALLEELLADHE
jgi:hypothetical protein